MSAGKKIKVIGVAGSGKMGTDIFLFMDAHGFEMRWLCRDDTERIAAEACFLKRLTRQKKTGMISDAGHARKLEKTRVSCEPSIFADCDLIIECITEDRTEKQRLFAALDEYVPAGCIITSNSSSIKPSLLLSSEERKAAFAGLHFFYPLALRSATELIFTEYTSETTKVVLREFLSGLDRNIFELDETNAFILNRIFLPVQAEACRLAGAGIMDFREIDALVKQDILPCGIFTFFDQVGNDIMLASVKNYMEFESGNADLTPLINLLENKVAENALGTKTGIGFYDYRSPDHDAPEINMADENVQICAGLLRNIYHESARMMAARTGANPDKLNDALMEYSGADRGPFSGNREQ